MPGKILGHTPPFAHPSILYRRSDFEATGGYPPNTDYFEDIELYRRLATRGALLVIVAPLVSIRFAGQHPRLHDNREEVLRKVDRQFHANPDAAGDRPVTIMAYYSIAVHKILALQRPRMLGEMLRRAQFGSPLRALAILGYVSVAEISPRLARFIGNSAVWTRERFAARRLDGDLVREWTPG